MALPIGGARGRLLPVSEGDHGRSQSVSCSVVSHSFNPMDCSLPGSSVHGISQARMGSHSTGVGCHSLLQGILPTQGWNLGLPHCRQILYHLSHQLSPMTTLQFILAATAGFSSSSCFQHFQNQHTTSLPCSEIPALIGQHALSRGGSVSSPVSRLSF